MLPKETLIIIIVTASVVGLVVAFALFRLLVRLCSSRENPPIPAPQPLARHRELAAASRPQTMYHSSESLVLPAPPFRSHRSSLVSMPPNVRHGSSNEGTTESGSDMTLNTPMEPLDNPNPSFNPVNPSSASLNSTEHEEVSPSASSSFSHGTGTSSQRPLHSQSRSRSRRRSSGQGSRPASLASTNSRHTLRGVPHGPYSNVQVVLPAPLAAGLQPSAQDRTSGYERYSMVDSWASLPVREARSARPPRSSTERRRSSTSSIGSSSNGHDSQLRTPRRSSSSLSPSSSPSPSPLSSAYSVNPYTAPPVPRIPSIYNTYPPPDAFPETVPNRGRPVAPASAPASQLPV